MTHPPIPPAVADPRPEPPTYQPLDVTGWSPEEVSDQQALDDETEQNYQLDLAAWRERNPDALHDFRVTFGQRYRHEPHPAFGGAHPDGWLTIVAADETEAREAAFGWLGDQWAFIYTDADFSPDLYPLGELHRIVAEQVPA